MSPPRPETLIRDAKRADDAAVELVRAAAFARVRDIYRPTDETLARQTQFTIESTRLVAEVAGRVAGTVEYDVHETHLHLIGLAVHPEFQRLGLSRALVDKIAAQARNLGRRVVALTTIKETGNVAVFEKLGFRVVREEVATWCVGDLYSKLHDVHMERHAWPK